MQETMVSIDKPASAILTESAMPKAIAGYRPEIDGLRAWAVGLIALFHFGLAFGGGFVGVDVFFVISGYLITGQIAADVKRRQFSVLTFYERRVRRIIPALMVVMAVTLALGMLLVLPAGLKRMSESAMASVLFVSNIRFWRLSENYFGPSADLDPFLHTWSLSVEEQFYIFFPLFFALLFRRSRTLIIAVCSVVLLATLAVSEIASSLAPTANFFLSPTRAWEFLTGSLLAISAVPALRGVAANSALALAGLVMIVGSGIFLSPEFGFPGLLAVPPVLGTALVIHCGGNMQALASRALTARPVVGLGKISYSLYLWHWPVLVFARHYILKRPLETIEAVFALALSVALAILSYRFVEEPVRRRPAFRVKRTLFATAGAMTAIVMALSLLGIASNGLMVRHPGLKDLDVHKQVAAEKPASVAVFDDCFLRKIGGWRVDGCILADGATAGSPNVLLWGDSFALHYEPALTELDEAPGGRGIVSFASPQCPPVIGYDPINLPACRKINDAALEQIRTRNVDTVILAANWYSYILLNRIEIADIAATVHTLRSMGVKVVVIGQSPTYHFAQPDEAYYEHIRSGRDLKLARAPNGAPRSLNRKIIEITRGDGVGFVNPESVFCSGDMCTYRDDGGYLVKDYGHLTLHGSRRMVPVIMDKIAKVVGESEVPR